MAPTYTIEIIIHGAHNLPVADLNSLACDPYIHARLLGPNPSSHDDEDDEVTFRTPTVRRSRDAEWCPSISGTHSNACREHEAESSKPGDSHAPACGSSGRWVVGGVPRTGIVLKLHVRDEDPGSSDDSLGRVTITFSPEQLDQGVSSAKYEVKKRHAAPHVYAFTYLAAMLPGVHVDKHAYVELSLRVVEKTLGSPNGRMYTIGPSKWTQHFSPLIGAVLPTRHAPGTGGDHGNLKSSVFVSNKLQLAGPVPKELHHRFVGYTAFVKWTFKAQGIQGLVLNRAAKKQYRTIYSYDKNTKYGVVDGGPADHFRRPGSDNRPGKGEREAASGAHAKQLALRFLRMTNFGIGGRMFTYVITLDGEWRFTETGDEFAVDLLSKHSMHADLALDIAFSGEFFVRRVVDQPGGGFESGIKVEDGTIADEEKEEGDKKGEEKAEKTENGKKAEKADQGDGKNGKDNTEEKVNKAGIKERDENGGCHEGTSGQTEGDNESAHQQDNYHQQADPHQDHDANTKDEPIVQDPSVYELVIDNDSGTYRPKKALLPTLRTWLMDNSRLGALGRVTAVDGFDEGLKKEKEARSALRKKGKGVPPSEPKQPRNGVGKVVDVAEEQQQKVMAAVGKDQSKAKTNDAPGRMVLPRRGSSVSSIESGVLGPDRRGSVSSREVEDIMHEAQKGDGHINGDALGQANSDEQAR